MHLKQEENVISDYEIIAVAMKNKNESVKSGQSYICNNVGMIMGDDELFLWYG